MRGLARGAFAVGLATAALAACSGGEASGKRPALAPGSSASPPDPWSCAEGTTQIARCGFGQRPEDGGAALCVGGAGAARGEGWTRVISRIKEPGATEVREKAWEGEALGRVRWRGEWGEAAASVRIELPATPQAQWTWTTHEDVVSGEVVATLRQASPLEPARIRPCRRASAVRLGVWQAGGASRLEWSELW